MALISDHDIERIAQRIAADLTVSSRVADVAPVMQTEQVSGLGVYATIHDAVMAAKQAFGKFTHLSLETRQSIIEAIRATMREHGTALAKAALDETGMGRLEDKIAKNKLVTEKTPGIEDLQPTAYSGDRGLTLIEPAPFGVIGAITPTTNPTSTIICNTIGMLAAGNCVVFNVHPNARHCSMQTIQLINKTITATGGPPNVVTCVQDPTVASAQELMQHPDIRLIVVTGGGGVVKAAMASGKRACCAGPGNPPVVVDETADIDQAAHDIVYGASTDNNIICVDEKEVIVVESVADQLLKAMAAHNAAIIDRKHLSQLENTIFEEMHGPRTSAKIRREYIGQNADYILSKMGMAVPSSIRLGVIEVDENHPLPWTEQMMPIMPVVRVPNADYAIDLAIEMEQGNCHSAIMHSKNLDNLSRMARECNCSIFVKNGRAVSGLGLGGEGYTSFTIASPTGEGLTGPRSFSRSRRCVLVDHFRIV